MKRLVGALIVVLLAVIVGRYAYYGLGKLTWFNLADVRISCSDRIKQEDVLKISNLKIGESIFHQDLEYAGNVLLEIPEVEIVNISRKLPNSVAINLVSDQIELLVKTGNLYGLTRTLKLVDLKNSNLVLPVITGITSSGKLNYNDKKE